MPSYSVVAHDGQVYGPADENGISEWIRQGRVGRQTVLLCHDTNARSEAWTVPALQPALGLSPNEVTRLLQGTLPAPTAVQPIGYASAPAALGYGQPIVHGPVMGLQVSSFPVAATVLLSIFVPYFAIIYYGIVHGNLPRRRPDDPGTGKAIGFTFIPFFNLYWIPFFWIRLCTRINDERQRVGLPPTAPRGLVVAILWCFLGFFIPFVNILVMLAIFVMMILVLIQLQGSINGLADATRVS